MKESSNSFREMVRRITPRAVRNWVRQPRRSLRYFADRVKYAWRGASQIQIRSDWLLRCHPASLDHFRVFVADPAQASELDSFIKYCRHEMRFLDVGAHYGLFSLAAVRYGGANVRVVSVEASSKASKIMRQNVIANNALNQVQIVTAAMGDYDGQLAMLSTGPAGSDYFVSAPEGRADTTRIRQLSMPTILAQTRLKPTHLKIDIEGFEDEALAGALECLREHQPVIFLELHVRFLHARGREPERIIRRLEECGYVTFEEDGLPVSGKDLATRDSDCRVVCFPKSYEQSLNFAPLKCE